MFQQVSHFGRFGTRKLVAAIVATVLGAASLLLVAPSAAHAATVTGNPLAGLAGFTVVSTGDISFGNTELEGSAAAGGDVRVSSGSPYSLIHSAAGNGNYTLPQAADGSYFRLIAGGTFDTAGSTSLVRVTSGGSPGTAATQGLIALGSTSGVNVTSRGSGVCVQAPAVSDCSGNTLEQTNFTQTPASVSRPGVFDEFIPASARADVSGWSSCIANDQILDTVAVTLAASGSDFDLDLTAGKVNVLTVNASDLPAGDWKLGFTGVRPSATTPLVIRVIAADGAVVNLPIETLGFQDAPGGVTDDDYARYMLWNIQQSPGQSVSVTSNGIVPGSFLAPNSTFTTGPGKTLIEGQIYAAKVDLSNAGEIHHYAFAPQLSCNTAAAATGGFSIHKALSGPAGLVPANTQFTVEYSVDGGAPQPLTLLADGTAVAVNGLPVGAVVTFSEGAKPTVPGVVWGTATFSPTTVTVGANTVTDVTLTNDYTAAAVATGGFAIHKALSGPAGLVPANTQFTVDYSIDGGAPQSLTLLADGSVVTVNGLAVGAVVTFSEGAKPTVPGVVWGAANFSPTTVTVGANTVTDVTLTNDYTAALGATSLSSQALVGGVANGTISDPSTPIVDRIDYTNVDAGAHYTLKGELVYVAGGVIQHTGITSQVAFDAASTPGPQVSGQIDMPFSLTAAQIQDLVGKPVFIFQSLFDASNTLVASDEATSATDPWFSTTHEWFEAAATQTGGQTGSTDGGSSSLAATGIDLGVPLAIGVVALLLGLALMGIALWRRAQRRRGQR